jgi:hypothetical protein
MSPSIKHVFKIVLVVLLAAAGGLFVFDYMEVHFKPAVRYQLEILGGRSMALVYRGEADDQYYFSGNTGYAWEVKPLQIDKYGAVLDVRIKKMDRITGMDEARQELKSVESQRLSLKPGQSVTIGANDGTPAVLTNLAVANTSEW